MKIVVNTRLLLKNKLEGIGWFTYEVFKRITTQHPEHTFYFIFDRKYHPDFIFSDNIKPIVIPPQARHPILYYLWFEFSIPYLLRRIKPDVFVSPDGYLSLSTKTPSLVVFHDLSFEHYPKDIPFLNRKYYQYFFPKYAKKASRIFTVSEYSKSDIVKQYGINGSTIDVAYNGASEFYKPLSDHEKELTLQKYTEGCSYFIFIGALHPRKNIANLLLAFDFFKKRDNSSVKLLLVGQKKWWTKEMQDIYAQMSFKSDVIFSGRLEPAELQKVLGSALALTYVSYFEGFGIPIVEAFNCNTPVITSNVTSMPEVAKDAALLIDPFSVESIAEAMQAIFSNEDLRKDLIKKGELRKKDFTWQHTADALWEAIQKTVNH